MKTVAIALIALVQGQSTTPAPVLPGQNPAQAPASADMKVYNNDELNILFNYPKTWKVHKVKVKNDWVKQIKVLDPKTWRPPKADETARFIVPIQGSADTGMLEIYAVQFFSEPDIWQ